MNVSILIQTIEANLTEVKGQLEENGADDPQFKEAVRQLSESVDLLRETTEGR